jgi:acetylornithine deacetylase/succinyl-diaminopimelate desuccinylase-like protein
MRFRSPSRIAATAIAAATVALSSPAWSQQGPLNANQQLAHDVYKQLIEINTADTVGSVTKAVDAMAARFRAAGFPEADIHIMTPAGHPTKANLIVRYRGTTSEKPILLLAHLDVVAALRSDWTIEPFVLTEKDGYYYGRGTSDDKAMAAIFVANLLRDRAAGWKPNRDIILALTADEESGDSNGVEWLTASHRDMIDAAFAVNEGGGGSMRNGKPFSNSIQAAEKVSVHFTITATNKGGHSSVPRPDNAIYELAHALEKLEHFQFPIQLNEISRAYLTQTAALDTGKLASAMRAIVSNPNDASANATLSADPRYNSMLRTTCVATRLSGGHAYNALPQTATANINCRIVPTQSPTEVHETLARVFADTGIRITETFPILVKGGAAPSPLTPELMNAVTEVTHSMYGANVAVVPVMSTGATDGRYLRAIGIPTYGVSGIMGDGDSRAHGRDERLPIKSFYDGQEFLYRLTHKLAGGK